ncbi:hypothetical protein D3C81_688020 [compost metagenome]
MENNNNNNNTPEEVGKMIGAAVNEIISSQQNDETDNQDTLDGVRRRRDGQPDGRQVSPIRGGRDPERRAAEE